jgi:glycosyltransferase involved in cell wall biosynthesis
LRVLLLGRYGRKGASTRLRFLQFLPYLQAAGIDVTSVPLLDDEYLRVLYSGGGRSSGRLMRAYAARLAWLTRAGKFDLLWIEKELFPRLPATLERLLARLGRAYVVDYDDAVFHDYDLHPNRYFRRALSRKIDQVMRHASLVVAGNEYLAERSRHAGARDTRILPTVVDLERFPAGPAPRRADFSVGWIGTPMTSGYLEQVRAPLAALLACGSSRIVAVGAGADPVPGVPVEVRPWTEGGEVEAIRQFDAGIMPLPDEPWERGKCGYKLIQYMACGLPVVASAVGANVEIVQQGVNGFLARNDREWTAALQALREDPDLRQRMGRAGRRLVEERYCLQVAAPRLLGMLRHAARHEGVT